jgi:pilus assembly protein Flp/PilA
MERGGVRPKLSGTYPLLPGPSKEFSMLEMFVAVQAWMTGRKAEIEERGATAVEYALMVGLIAVAIIASVTLLGGKVKTTFNRIANTLPS